MSRVDSTSSKSFSSMRAMSNSKISAASLFCRKEVLDLKCSEKTSLEVIRLKSMQKRPKSVSKGIENHKKTSENASKNVGQVALSASRA